MNEPPDSDTVPTHHPGKKYLNVEIPLTFTQEGNGKVNTAAGSRFLLNDSYLPLTSRQMVHGWRLLRKKSGLRPGANLDVRATVQQMAREGLLLKPVYEKEPVNSDNLLLILADRTGSMAPFHHLTDKLVESALHAGGHKKAMVFYFYNCPVGYVYEDKGLSKPVPLARLYSQMQPFHTNALVISDAGAARGNLNRDRALKTFEFLYGGMENGVETLGLHKSALFVSWLNPMPRHRWAHTTASYIDRERDTPMYPLMEDGYANFLSLIGKLMGG